MASAPARRDLVPGP